VLELISLILLGTTAATSLCGFDAFLVGLDITAGTAHETARGLPGSLEFANCRLSEQVNLDQVALEGALEGDDGLDEERVGVLEVKVHDGHHADTHDLALEQAAELLSVVCVHSGGDGLGLLSRSHGCGLNVLDDGEICRFS
jgi:hypothetical protein